MNTDWRIPEISDEHLAELLMEIQPVVRMGGVLWHIAPVHPRTQSFTWDLVLTMPAEPVKVIGSSPTFHTYGAPSLFKPSVAEVLAQIPPEWEERVVAFEMTHRDLDSRYVLAEGYHVASVIFYSRSETDPTSLEAVEAEE